LFYDIYSVETRVQQAETAARQWVHR